MTSRSAIWSLAAGALLLLALTWIVSPLVVQSQERRPVFDASECIPTQGGYQDNGHSAVPGAIVCKYYKQSAANPDAENYKSMYLTYWSTPEEALAELRERFLTDDHVKHFLCETWDDCDKIERGLLERTDNSLYGYANTLTNDPVHYSLERRFVDGSYTVTIFVQGEVFASLDEAKAEVAELEQFARALVAAPRDWIALVDPGSTGTPGAVTEEPADPNVGKSCSDYCKELDPPRSQYVSGETYPDCDCACWTGKLFFEGKCVSCDWLCDDDETYTVSPHFEECFCLCKDPAMTWDRASGECVPGEDRTGMACSEYCDLVDPGVGWKAPGSGETYPDCDCWCDPKGGAGGATYINGLCVPCQSACKGDDVFLLQPRDGPCRCMCQDHTKVWDQATGQCLPAEDKTGMACTDYCAQLEPGGGVPLASSGQTYPDCQCQCGDDGRQYTFFQNQCVPCTEMCRGEGMSVFPQKGGECVCTCNDPLFKWDRASGACVPLDGSECFTGNGCQTQKGENCANCSDCTCDIVSAVDPSLRLSKVCQPDHPLADNRGCVVAEESMTPQEQLETQQAQWEECRDAWALMNLSMLSVFKGDAQVVMSTMATLPQVAHWQRQCSCVPQSGVVVFNEAKDAMICLIRCCDRILDGVDAQEERIKGFIPVVRGPGIKTRPADAPVEVLEGRVIKIDGSLDLWGDIPNPLITHFGGGSPRSQYEIVHRPESGMEVYLYEGSYTHTYYDEEEGAITQVEIEPGMMLSIGPGGVVLSYSSFDVASREPWWEEAPYRVVCPEGSHQEGADCYCDEGYVVDAARHVCVPLIAWTRPAQAEVVTEPVATAPAPAPAATAESPTDSPPLVEVTVTPGSGSGAGTATVTGLLLVIVGGLVLLVVILVAVLIVVLRRRR